MAKQDFEQFKQDVKEWLNSHPEEYDRFVVCADNIIVDCDYAGDGVSV